jgi:hypothetical protein
VGFARWCVDTTGGTFTPAMPLDAALSQPFDRAKLVAAMARWAVS